ncbi:hypothetical protein FTX61_11100 [Nitriliruptoraceae bacterium ZYF776]|nr:hypothetical protein [Profundirhabdus halotolerans]
MSRPSSTACTASFWPARSARTSSRSRAAVRSDPVVCSPNPAPVAANGGTLPRRPPPGGRQPPANDPGACPHPWRGGVPRPSASAHRPPTPSARRAPLGSVAAGAPGPRRCAPTCPRWPGGPVRSRTAVAAVATLLAAPLVVLDDPDRAAAASRSASTPTARGTSLLCPPGEVPPAGFADPLDPFDDVVGCLVGHDVVQGRTPTTFEPNGEVTRAQLAAFTHRALGVADAAPTWDGEHRFDDVATSGTHVAEIGALAAPDATSDGPVLRGFDDGRFGPREPMSRQQAVSTIDRALRAAVPQLDVPEATGCGFTDVDGIAPAHREPARRLCALGVAQGRTDGRFAPQGTVTRGQAAAFLARALDVAADAGRVTSPFPVAVEVLADGLEAPWEVVRTDVGRWFLTERDTGRVLELVDGRLEERRRFAVVTRNSNGLLGLAAEPGGERLFAYLTTADDNRIVAFHPDGGEVEPIVTGLPNGPIHAGGRLTFGPDGMLYLGIGDATPTSAAYDDQRRRARDPQDLAGKILRVTPEGGIPEDNPYGNAVWALGLRNVQGLAFDDDGRLWATDFGDDVDDEVNLVEPGGDYGWPDATGTDVHDGSLPAAFVRQPPVASWSGAGIVTSELGFADPGDLLVGALRGQRLWRLQLDGDRIVDAEDLLVGHLGRIRQVLDVGDGGLYVLTDNATRGLGPFDGDALLRLTPRS